MLPEIFSSSNLLLLTLTTVANFVLALFIYLRNRKSVTHQAAGLFVLGIAGWTLSILCFNLTKDIIWARLAFSFPSLIPFGFYLFIDRFAIKEQRPLNSEESVMLALTFFFVVISLTPLVVRSAFLTSGGISGRKGPLYPFFTVYFIFVVMLAFRKFFIHYRSSQGVQRLRLKYILMGFLVFAVLALSSNLILPALGINIFNNVGPLSSVVMVAAIIYSIVKHRFMDIRLAVRAVLFRMLIIVVLTILFASAVTIYRRLPAYSENESFYMVVSSFLTACVVAIFYRPLEILLKGATDQLFFQKEYSHQGLIRDLGKQISESVNLKTILEEIEHALQEVMKVRYVGFVILQDEIENRRMEENGLVEARGPSEITLRGFAEEAHPWKVEDVLLKEMEYDPRVIVVDELRRDIEAEEDPLRRKRQQKILEALEDLDAAVLAPLPSKEGLLGVMALGEKKSMEAFTVQDIQAVEAVVYQSGIAIENAVLFEQVRNFNRRLRQDIREATRDLALKNKNLSVLRNLDQIIINTLEFEELGKKLVDVVAWEMGYVGALLCYVDEEAGQLRGLALSDSPGFKRVRQLLGREVNQYSLDLDLDPSNLLIRSLRERKSFHSADLAAFLTPLLNKKVVQKIQQVSGIRHAVSFSLSSKGRSLGVILIGLSKSFQELETNELELLQSFVNEAGIALENAKMYTEVRGINQQLVEANARLKELDRMKDELVSIASHELRTPMTAIKSYVYMALEKRSDEVSDKVREYLRKAYDSSERMIRLINDMLSVSRLDTGRLKVDPQPMEIGGLVKEVTEELAVTAGEKNIRFELDLPNEIPLVWADKDRIREVLVNLLGNAIKFSFPNSAVRVGAREERDRVLVAVTDDGPGMSWDDQERLFKKFSRLQHSFSTMAEGQGGTGLGLYISKGIVELHGGEIWVESEEGKGSTFTFSLRIVEKS